MKNVLIVTFSGEGILFKSEDLRILGRISKGVSGIKQKMGNSVASVISVPDNQESVQVVLISQNGLAKRVPIDHFRLQSRGGRGMRLYKVTPKTGLLTGACVIKSGIDDDTFIVITTHKGIIKKMRAGDITEAGRNASGSLAIKLDEGDSVAGITVI